MADVVQLMTQLRMDSSEFTRKISEAKEKVSEFARESDSSFRTLGFSLGTIAAGSLALFSYKIGEAVNHINELYETSRKIGTSTSELQELQGALATFGVGGEQVVKMIGFMQKAIGEARMGNEQYANSFKILKLNVDELAKKSTVDQLLDIAKATKEIKDQSVQVAEVRKQFGRSGQDMLFAIRSGELEEKLQQYKGTGIDDASAAKVHELVDRLALSGARFKKVMNDIVASMADPIEHLLDKIDLVAKHIHEALQIQPKTADEVNALPTDQKWTYANPRAILGNPALLRQNIANTFNNNTPNMPGNSYIAPIGTLSPKSAAEIEAAEKIKKMGDAADDASYNLKNLSTISEMLKSADKKNTQDALKDLLGDTLTGKDPAMNIKNLSKPFESFEAWSKEQQSMGFTNNTNAGYIQAKAEHDLTQDANISNYQSFQEQFQQVFQDAKKYGLKGHPITGGIGGNQTVQDEINDLKQSAKGLGTGTGFDTSGIVGAVNDLEKFAKEQKNKDNKVEMTIKLDPGLLADVKSAEGIKITMKNEAISKSELAAAASSMGK